MSSILEKTVITKSVDELWELVLDPATFVESFSDNYGFQYDVLPSKFVNGAVLSFEMSRWYIGQEWKLEVNLREDTKDLFLSQVHGPFKKWRLHIKVEDHGDGQSLVTESLIYKMPYSVLGGIVDDLFFRRDLRQQLKSHQSFLRAKA